MLVHSLREFKTLITQPLSEIDFGMYEHHTPEEYDMLLERIVSSRHIKSVKCGVRMTCEDVCRMIDALGKDKGRDAFSMKLYPCVYTDEELVKIRHSLVEGAERMTSLTFNMIHYEYPTRRAIMDIVFALLESKQENLYLGSAHITLTEEEKSKIRSILITEPGKLRIIEFENFKHVLHHPAEEVEVMLSKKL